MNIIAFDTSTELLCAALIAAAPGAEERSAELCIDAGLRHAELLMASVDQLCRLLGIEASAINGVVAGRGPGSFTGLRIGMASAKGLAEARRLPLASVSALDAMAFRHRHWPGPVLCVSDARKGRFYAGLSEAGHRRGAFRDLAALDILSWLLADCPARASILVTGPHTELFMERVAGDAAVRELQSRLMLVADPEPRKGFGLELARLGQRRIDAGNWDPPDFGADYLRDSDAELGVTARKASS